MTEEFFDTNQAAEFLELKPNTLEVWRWQGRGPRFVRLSRRAIRYQLSDLLKFGRARIVEPEKKRRDPCQRIAAR
jgi:hypothetical protein